VTYQLRILPAALKELGSLSELMRRRLDKAILALLEEPRPAGFVALKGKLRGLSRIRVGDYRIVYRIEDDVLVIVIVKVGHRRNIYE